MGFWKIVSGPHPDQIESNPTTSSNRLDNLNAPSPPPPAPPVDSSITRHSNMSSMGLPPVRLTLRPVSIDSFPSSPVLIACPPSFNPFVFSFASNATFNSYHFLSRLWQDGFLLSSPLPRPPALGTPPTPCRLRLQHPRRCHPSPVEHARVCPRVPRGPHLPERGLVPLAVDCRWTR